MLLPVHSVDICLYRLAAAGRDDRQPSIIFSRSLLPCHRNTKGVLRVDQVIHALGGICDRELYARNLTIERVTRGAIIWGDWRTAVLADIAAVVG